MKKNTDYIFYILSHENMTWHDLTFGSNQNNKNTLSFEQIKYPLKSKNLLWYSGKIFGKVGKMRNEKNLKLKCEIQIKIKDEGEKILEL